VATGERKKPAPFKRRALSEDPDIARLATSAADEAVSEGSWRARFASPPPEQEDWEEDEYYDLSPEPDAGRGYSPELEYDGPDLEEPGAAYPPEEEEEGDAYDAYEAEREVSLDPDLGPESDPGECDPDPGECYPDPGVCDPDAEDAMEEAHSVRALSPEPDQERQYTPDPEPGSTRDQPVEESDGPDVAIKGDCSAEDGSNMVDQMVVLAALDDEPSSDVSEGSRAKLTQMKSEAAQRLDDLEKLIDEHQEIVEELKRTESSQGSLADMANKSLTPSPVPDRRRLSPDPMAASPEARTLSPEATRASPGETPLEEAPDSPEETLAETAQGDASASEALYTATEELHEDAEEGEGELESP